MLRLKILRENAGIKQSTLGDILHIPQSSMSHYENGTREPDYATLIKIANYFKVSVDYLIGNDKTGEKLSEIYAEKDVKIYSALEDIVSFSDEDINRITDYINLLKEKRKK